MDRKGGEADMPGRGLVVGYVSTRFPALTETFVYNEVKALRRLGATIHVFSIHPVDAGTISPDARALVDDTIYVWPSRLPSVVLAQAYFLVHHPLRYGSIVGSYVIGRNLGRWKHLVRTLGHFLEAGVVAWESRRRGIRHHHAHFASGPASVVMFAALLNRTTFSFTVHANDLFCDPILLEDKIALSRFVVVVSRFNRETILHDYPSADPRKLVVHSYGIDVRAFEPAPAPGRQRPCVLSVGRLIEKKGFAVLIEACALLRDRGYGVDCVIIGEGPDRRQLEDLISRHRLEQCVVLPGMVFHDEMKARYAGADVFALPCVRAKDNDLDGIPNVLIEAMAMALPCVSTTVSGIPELIRSEDNGILVEPGDARALADAVMRLIGDQALRARLGRKARRTVEESFNLETTVRRLAGLFQAGGGSDGAGEGLRACEPGM